MRSVFLALVLVVTCTTTISAQLVVTDPAVTIRNSITAGLKEYLLNLQAQQHSELRRMAHRLSRFTDLRKYAVEDPPRWRIHPFEDGGEVLFANRYHAALNYGDSTGAGYLAVSHPLVAAKHQLGALTRAAQQAVEARLATIDVADAVAVAATHGTGQLRYNGRRELAAIDALERHVVDPSDEQSATSVLDKISGAVLIGARQKQARAQLLVGVVEQLLLESKRARDAEAASMNMQLTNWRDSRAANEAFAAGTGDALQAWRQP